MKKLFLVAIALSASTLIGCGPTTSSNGESSSSASVDNRTVLTYAAWNLDTVEKNNIERRMIDAFEVKYPAIRVDVIERPRAVDEEGNEYDVSWDEFFATQAAIGKMPDIFQSDSVIKAVLNGWAKDVTTIANADPDFLSIPADIRNSSVIRDRLFALPQALFYQGYFINRTVINQTGAGAIIPEYGITYNDLMAAAQADSKPALMGGDGIAGIDGVNELYGWLPAQHDASLGWFTFNQEGYHLDSEAFRVSMEEQQKYFGAGKTAYSGYVLETQTNQPDRYGTGNPFENAKQSIAWGGSYNLRNFVEYTQTVGKGLYGCDIDFIGTPSVMVGSDLVHRIPVTIDYLGIGEGTAHPEEAYLFAKWMGFGTEGYTKRLQIASEFPEAGAVNFAPIVQDETLLNQYFAMYPTLTEFKKIVMEHTDFIIESLAKTVPGYVASRWTGRYDATRTIAIALDNIRDGTLSLADALAAGLNDLSNAEYEAVQAQLDELFGPQTRRIPTL